MKKLLFLSTIMIGVMLLAGCGGPSATEVWQHVDKEIISAQQQVESGKWDQALIKWDAALQKATPILDEEVDGKSVRNKLEEEKSKISKAITTAMPAMITAAEQNRETYRSVMKLIATLADRSDHQKWLDEHGTRIDALLNKKAADEKAAQEAARLAALAKSYVVVIGGLHEKKYEDVEIKKKLMESLRSVFAPIDIVVFDKRPVRRTGLGFVQLILQWDEVSYGDSFSSMNRVPEALTAQFKITTYGTPSSLDGTKTWEATTKLPQKVNMFGINSLASKKREELATTVMTELKKLKIDNAEQLLAQAVDRTQQPVWLYTFTAQTITEKSGKMMGQSYKSYEIDVVDAFANLAKSCDFLNIMEATKDDNVVGTLEFSLTVSEYAVGADTGAIQTINGNVPSDIIVQVTVKPKTGMAKWLEGQKVFKASLSDVQPFAKDKLYAVINERMMKMINSIRAQAEKAGPFIEEEK